MTSEIENLTTEELKSRVKKATKIEDGKLVIDDAEIVSLISEKSAGNYHGFFDICPKIKNDCQK